MGGLFKVVVGRFGFLRNYFNTYQLWFGAQTLGYPSGMGGRRAGSLAAFDIFWDGYRTYLRSRGVAEERAIQVVHFLLLACPDQATRMRPGECLFYARGQKMLDETYTPRF
jgi:hypothetical protein